MANLSEEDIASLLVLVRRRIRYNAARRKKRLNPEGEDANFINKQRLEKLAEKLEGMQNEPVREGDRQGLAPPVQENR